MTMISPKTIDRFRIEPGARVRIADHDPGWAQTKSLARLGKEVVKERALQILAKAVGELDQAQQLLWASNTHSVLIVLQAMDTAGKDGIIRHVMSGVNPQGCDVHDFKRPSQLELDHTFLWRQMRVTPPRGKIVIFNRSHYEDVLVVRVHPSLLDHANLPEGKRGKSFWKRRYDDINNFERHLARNGTLVLKFFLNISKDEQRKRLLARLNDPAKHWKFEVADLAERAHWDKYMRAYEQAIAATSTAWAPWYIVPANSKWVARAVVADVLTYSIAKLGLKMPSVSDEKKRALEDARTTLENEPQHTPE